MNVVAVVPFPVMENEPGVPAGAPTAAFGTSVSGLALFTEVIVGWVGAAGSTVKWQIGDCA